MKNIIGTCLLLLAAGVTTACIRTEIPAQVHEAEATETETALHQQGDYAHIQRCGLDGVCLP